MKKSEARIEKSCWNAKRKGDGGYCSPPRNAFHALRNTGLTNVVVQPWLVEKQRRELLGATLLGVFGQLQVEGEVVHLVAKRLVDLSAWLGRLETSSRDFH